MKKALIISIGFNCLLVFVFAAKRIYYSSYSPELNKRDSSLNELYTLNRIDLFNGMPVCEGDIVFVGNSLTEGFPVTELYGIRVKNRGISGNITMDVLNRIDTIAKRKPSKIFLEIGINDLKNGISIDTAYKNYISIIKKIRSLSPETQLIIQSLTPTSGYYLPTNAEVVIMNRLLYDYCQTNNLIYIDIFNPLQSGNGLDSTYTKDGLHLNFAGYKIWREKIEKLLEFK